MPRTTNGIAALVLLAAVSGCVNPGAGYDAGPQPESTYSISGMVAGATAGGVAISLSGAATASAITAEDGSFAFAELANGSYTLTPAKAGFTFSPTTLMVTVAGSSVQGQSFTAASAAPAFNLSGTVTGATNAGVTVSLSGAVTAATTTDAAGSFSFTGLANGSYTLTPTKTGFTFAPATLIASVDGGSVDGQNFTATSVPGTYSISGTVSGATAAGVTVSLTGSMTGSGSTDASGNFTFTGLTNGSYTLTPTKAGFTFTPTTSAVVVNGANVQGKDFTATATPATYSISGAVGGATAAGVTLSLTGAATASTTTDGTGNFTFTGLVNGSYTLTPTKAGFTFTPTISAVVVNGASVQGKNFTASSVPTTYSISGSVNGATTSGVTLSLTGPANQTTTTDAAGSFSFTGLGNGNYALTPTKAGFSFTPTSMPVTVNGSNIGGRVFTASSVPTIQPCGSLASLTTAVANLENVRPSWATIDGWASGVSRLPAPAFRKGLNVLPSMFGMYNFTIRQHTDYWASISATYPVNVSPGVNAGPISPPHVDGAGNLLVYPFSGAPLDDKLRAISTILLCEKARGRPVVFAMQNLMNPTFASHAAFNTWVTSNYVPMVVEMAKAAERIKAEYLDPFPCEAESFLNRFKQPSLNTGTAALLADLNSWLAATREGVRPTGGASLFTGKLVGRSYAIYETGGYNDGAGGTTSNGVFWQGANFAGYDELHVTLSSNCSPTYLDDQLAGVQAVAGTLPWYISEVYLYSGGFMACGGVAANPREVYLTTLFGKLDALTGNKPLGVGVDINPEDDANLLSPAALTVITNFFNSH